VLNNGTRSTIPPIDGIDKIDYITADNWLDKKDLPKHLVIVGGGYVGLEMAQFYRRMGSKVTVIEQSDRIAGNEDRDVADELRKLLENEGIIFRLNAEVKSVQSKNGVLNLKIAEIGTSEMNASHIFIATGRKPNTDDLGLDTIGVETDSRGFVKTDEHLKTNVNNIWAAGDIRGGPMFTHTSYHDYRVIASDITGLGSRTRKKYIPYAIFTDPELGRAGMTERQAREAGYSFEVARFDMKKNGKAIEMGESEGFIKVLVNTKNNQIIGAAILAVEGAELVHLYADLMNAEAPYTVIRDAIYIHPTLAEAVQSAVSSLS
jgi:pyruvate/2-oxoglutarate dehydrogenase complex dihydrolipoamide dehydrogenase (E3) component